MRCIALDGNASELCFFKMTLIRMTTKIKILPKNGRKTKKVVHKPQKKWLCAKKVSAVPMSVYMSKLGNRMLKTRSLESRNR